MLGQGGVRGSTEETPDPGRSQGRPLGDRDGQTERAQRERAEELQEGGCGREAWPMMLDQMALSFTSGNGAELGRGPPSLWQAARDRRGASHLSTARSHHSPDLWGLNI